VIRWDAPGPYTVVFTTRIGGVSEGRYASLNLGLLTEDDRQRVAQNRKLACVAAGLDVDRLAMNRQAHGAAVNRASSGRRGEPGDGLWTEEPGVPLLALAADCLPIVLVRDGQPGVAALHAGRIGLLEGIVEAGAEALEGAGLAAAVGPGIGACCYEVGEEVSGPYRARFGPDVFVNGNLDLRTVADRLLRDAGVEHVDHVEICTACDAKHFFSHRRDGPRTGRQGVLAAID
jgi:purine-nucleoside/S-methyl-5'-thioadenosine phosphorylase / adenosine deaminase